ncbi:MAG: holo-ACP synthase [Chlorobiaceae bacterium]|nr:holo-ACP synthase [Chlorobiaceae bacterium]
MEIGVDIVEIERIRGSYERYGESFLRRILTEAEAAQCLDKPDPAASLAGRFAAKEAISKALGTGISHGLSWHSIEVLNDDAGKPQATIRFAGKEFTAKISISHDRHSAIAMAVIEES